MFTNSCRFLLALLIIAPVFAVNTHLFSVSGKDNIYASGQAVPPELLGGGGNLPYAIKLGSKVAGRTIQFSSVTGTVDCCTILSPEPNGPDGNTMHGRTDINPYGGLSGIKHTTRRMFLVGVFLDDNAPAGAPPPTLDFTADFLVLKPALRQVFFIGDGKSDFNGAIQTFEVPNDATRLFFGFADADSFFGKPGYYNDNGGILTVALNADIGAGLPTEATDVVVGPDRVYVLAGNKVYMLHRFTSMAGPKSSVKVYMLHRFTLTEDFGPAIEVTRPGLRSVDAIALYADRFLIAAGTVDSSTLGKTLMFVNAYQPSQPGVPSSLRWTWTSNVTARTTSVTGGSAADCLYIGGYGDFVTGGQTQTRGVIVKLRWGGATHWETWVDFWDYRETSPSFVAGLGAHPGFSNVQTAGWLTSSGVKRGFFQTFAESAGSPGPQHIWPEANSFGVDVAPGGPGKGVYAFGAVVGPPIPGGGNGPYGDRNDATQILRRYSFDGTLLWTQSFINPPDLNTNLRVAVDVATDSGGVWTGSSIVSNSGYRYTYLRYSGFNQEQLAHRYVEAEGYFLKAVGARDGAAYAVGDAASPAFVRGFVIKVTPR